MLAIFLILGATGDLDEMGSFVRAFSRSGAEGEIFTLTGRTELWATAGKLILDKPLLGWGYNGIEDVMARSVRTGFEGTATNAHNMLLQGIASLGFLGSLPAIAAIGLLCLRFVTRPDPARDQVAVLLIVTGLGEVGMAATPILLTLVVFYFFAREAKHSLTSQSRLEARPL
jgi:O-antigen ligase